MFVGVERPTRLSVVIIAGWRLLVDCLGKENSGANFLKGSPGCPSTDVTGPGRHTRVRVCRQQLSPYVSIFHNAATLEVVGFQVLMLTLKMLIHTCPPGQVFIAIDTPITTQSRFQILVEIQIIRAIVVESTSKLHQWQRKVKY